MRGGKLTLTQHLEVRLANKVTVYPEVDVKNVQEHWARRFNKLGLYVTGPQSWMELDLTDPEVVSELEAMEEQFSEDILQVFDSILPEPKHPLRKPRGQFRMLVVGQGPGRRIVNYIRRSEQLGGLCYGIDVLQECVSLLQLNLSKVQLSQHAHYFSQGLASELTKIYQAGSFNLITWERLGNHLLDDKVWEFSLRHEVVRLLKPGGMFLLVESLAELNPGRVFDPLSSIPRTFKQYDKTLSPPLVYLPEFEFHTSYTGDLYFIGVWQKPSRGRS